MVDDGDDNTVRRGLTVKPDVFASTPNVPDPTAAEGTVELPPPGYDIGALIGRGGMGEVLEADDRRIGRKVALKRMRTRPAGEPLARFLREARIQARLDHPAIVPVHELAIDADGRPYFTMKRVTGRTLAHRLADGGAQNRLLRAFVDVCLAIEYAHTRGVIHRDLKPANIMLGNFGEVYVLDWGVARVAGDSRAGTTEPLAHDDIATLDQTNTQMLGTPGYMAPEQLRGETTTPAADVYALGAILFEILAGQALHPRGEAAIGSTLARPQDSPLRRRGGDGVAPELDTVCTAALAELPAGRPSAHELAEAVQQYLDGDRDHERRRQLAAEQLAAARDALAGTAPDARVLAMRHAGRALALDPDSPAAAELVSSLLLQPPSPMPAPLADALEAHEREIAKHRSWRGFWAYLSIVLVAPLLLLLDVRSWPLVGAFYGVVAICALVAYAASRTGRQPLAFVLVANLALAILFTRIAGPFVLTPLATCCILVGITAIRRINPRSALVIAWTVVAVLGPFALEAAGVLPRSWAVAPDAIVSYSTMFASSTIEGASIALVTANLVFTLVVAFVALAFSRKRQEAQRALFVREWHLRQLISA